jgi:myo-inositol-1(or 4)-monophosphatase
MEPLALAIDVARRAGAYQMQHFGGPHTVALKGEANPVSDVDRACEQMIVEAITTHFPAHQIVAEEGGAGAASGDWQWIIDPLDGTVNYLHNYPLFCVCIALRSKAHTELGVIFEPNHNELFVATRGGGARCNDRLMQVTTRSALIDTVLASGFAYGRERGGELERNIPIFTSLLKKTQAIRRDGVAGVDLAYVAAGRFDGFWEYYLKPWDVAAGALLVEEATQMDGTTFDPFGIEILATNGVIHETLQSHIQEAATPHD